MKEVWIDTETTGVNAYNNGVIQISGMIACDNKVIETFNFKVAPFPKDKIDAKALEVNKITESELHGYPAPDIVYAQIVKLFGKYVNKFNKKDKMILCGYNTTFDAEMMRMWFKKNGDNYFYSYVFGGKLDVMSTVMGYSLTCNVEFQDHKLATTCAHFGIDANFHDALDDIKATRALYYKVLERQHEFLGRKFS